VKIIIADDSVTMQRIQQTMLASLGQTDTLLADSGDAVMELLAQHQDVGLILLDWNMPVMNGIDCLRAIRANPATKAIPVVMVTSEAVEEKVAFAIQSGANGYLTKPFEAKEFETAINRLVSGT
jgi:two-component system chemotaxis response regulator CheY